MKCHYCDEEATVHITQIVTHQKIELHLCSACADMHQIVGSTSTELNVPALMNLLLTSSGTLPRGEDRLICPSCGLEYDQFRKKGRLGCPHDFRTFRASLDNLFERLHRSTCHEGKGPRVHTDPDDWGYEPLDDLKDRLRESIAMERYEAAARLRDLIRERELADELG